MHRILVLTAEWLNLNLKIMKTYLNAIILGLFGAAAVTVSFMLQWPTWTMFLAWVSYYLFGKSIKTSIPVFVQIIFGILMGVAIMVSAKFFETIIGVAGFQLAVFLFIGSLAFLSKIEGLKSIPAWFIGLIIIFGVHPELEFVAIVSLLVPVIAGFTFAWLNDSSLKIVSKSFNN